MDLVKFVLPDGRVVDIHADVARSHLWIDFTEVGGRVVMAYRAEDVCVFYCVGVPSSFTWRKSMPYRDAREASIALMTTRNMNYPSFVGLATAELPAAFDDERTVQPMMCFVCGEQTGSYWHPLCWQHHPIYTSSVDFC